MQHGEGQRQHDTESLMISPGMMEIVEIRVILWGKRKRMHGDYTICLGMYGSGPLMLGNESIQVQASWIRFI